MAPDGFALSIMIGAAGIAVTHTVFGPDHFLPFIMLARARGWSLGRTLIITALSGVGHVASSVLLGALGLALGVTVAGLETAEGRRGQIAAWLLVAFGVAYAAWGLRRAMRRQAGYALHEHGAVVHVHAHGDHAHHHARSVGRDATFWTLFAVFVFGPCEPLIPLFVLPASRQRWGLAAATAAVFGVITITTMLLLTALGRAGLVRLPLGRLERWSHALAGGVIAASGLAIIVLGV